MVVYLHEALRHRLAQESHLTDKDVEQATIDGAVQRLRPKLMTVTAVILSLAPILWESGVGSDVMKPIAAPIVGGMITSTISGKESSRSGQHRYLVSLPKYPN